MSDNNNGNPMTGDIGLIRNILMGQQMDEYEKRFSQMKGEMEETQSKMQEALVSLGGTTDDRLDKLEKIFNERFDKLEQLLTVNVEKLNGRMDKVSKDDKNKLGKMLASMGQKLMDEGQ